MISVTEVSFSYGRGCSAQPVLNRVSLTSVPGAILGLVGPNGSGKSTLLKVMSRAVTPSTGHVDIDGSPIDRMPSKTLARHVAVVSQTTASGTHGASFSEGMTVAHTVSLGRSPYLGVFSDPGEKDAEMARIALEQVGIAHLAQRTCSELSGGELQRVFIARALVQDTKHLLLDEPTNHLDVKYQYELLARMRSLAHEGRDVIVVLHDLTLAAHYCDVVALMHQGEITAIGDPRGVLTSEHVRSVYDMDAEWVSSSRGEHLLVFPRTSDVSKTLATPR